MRRRVVRTAGRAAPRHRQPRSRAAGHARAPTAPARWDHTAPRSASWWWRPRATARCLRRCRAVPGQPGRATRPTTCPRRFEPPAGLAGRRSRTRRTTSAAAAASDGPDVRMIRRLGPPADSLSARSTKESSGHRRNALPALTWTTTRSWPPTGLPDASRHRRWRPPQGHAPSSPGRASGVGRSRPGSRGARMSHWFSTE